MSPTCPSRFASTLACVVLLALAVSTTSSAREPARAALLAQLRRASADPGLAQWQRDFYAERLARETSGPAPTASRAPAAPAVAWYPAPAWSRIAETPRRMGHSAVVDPATNRLLVFGGSNGTRLFSDVFALDLSGGLGWRKLAVAAPGPSARWGHVAVLDAGHRRMLVYGGIDADGSYLGDVWALSLDGTPAWTQLEPGGATPSARANHLAVVDTLGGRLLVYGGVNGGFNPLADLWSLSLGDTPAWASVAVAGAWPTGLTPGGLMIDEARHRLWLAGVQTVNYSTNVVFYSMPLGTLSPTWSSSVAPYTNGPYYYSGALRFFFDAAGDRFVCVPTDYAASAYTLPAGSAWSQWTSWTWSTASLPIVQSGSAWVTDAAHHRELMCGGGPGAYSSSRTSSDLWAYDLVGLVSWTRLAGEPAPRSGHALATNPADGGVLLFGGAVDSTGGGYYFTPSNDLWTLPGSDVSGWSLLPATGGPLVPRSGAEAIVDQVNSRMLVFGGTNTGVYTNELWQRPLAGVAWSQVAPVGVLPHQRSEPAVTLDPLSRRMLVFGGLDGASAGLGYLGDLWTFSLDGLPVWTKLSPAGAGPAPRSGALFAVDAADTCAFLVGGSNSNGYYGTGTVRAGEVWALSLTGQGRWRQVASGLDGPSYASDEVTCAAFWDPAAHALVRVAWRYDQPDPVVEAMRPATDSTWTPIGATGVPPHPQSTARGVFDPGTRRLTWFGGTDVGEEGTWALAFVAPPLAVPSPRAGLASGLEVSPNPATRRVTLRFTLPRAGGVRLELVDVAGRRVRGPVEALLPAGPAELSIDDAATLPAGVYLARVDGALARTARVAIVH